MLATETNQPSIRVTEVGEYVRFYGCDRRFKLNTHKNSVIPRQHPALGMIQESLLDPVLTAAGRQREDECAAYLKASGFDEVSASDPDARTLLWADWLNAIQQLAPGQLAYAREVAVEAELGGFHVRGQVDFVLLQWRENQPYFRLVESKASRKDQTYQRVQVALYQMIVQNLLSSGIQVSHQQLKPDHVEAVVVRIDVETSTIQNLVEIEAFDLSLEQSDLQHLLRSGGTLDQILSKPLDELDYTINGKCADCKFAVYCLPESARYRRLELLGLQPPIIRVLQAAEVQTLDDLADLDLQGNQAQQIRQDDSFTDSLDRLKTLATARRTTLPGYGDADSYEVTPLSSKIQSQLPPYEIQGQRLIRVYLIVDYDYVENRIGCLSAHVTKSQGLLETNFKQEGDRWVPDPNIREKLGDKIKKVNGKSVARRASKPWTGNMAEDTAKEAKTLESFFRDLVNAIRVVAGEDTKAAPVHFYVWSHQEMKQLIEACTRTSTQLLGHFKELLGCRAGLEQPIYSCLQQEVDNRFALGWTGRDLMVVTSLKWFGQRYHWHRMVEGRPTALDHEFRQDLFDYRRRLHLNPTGEFTKNETGKRHLFEVRLRMQRSLSAPYFRALWGTLPDPTSVETMLGKAIERYNIAKDHQKFECFIRSRIHGLRWIEEKITRKNDEIQKEALDLDTLTSFSLGVHSVAQAALDFLRLDHHIKVSNWLSTSLNCSPLYRVGQGRMIPLKAVRSIGNQKYQATIDYEAYGLTPAILENNCTLGEGSFVRLVPAHADPQQTQSLSQLTKMGVTCEINSLDYERRVVKLSLRGRFGSSGDPYVLVNQIPTNGLDHAVLEESVTDFVAGKVDERLVEVQGQTGVSQWFDPIQPQVPSQTPLNTDIQVKAADFLESLIVRPESNSGLAPDQRRAILEGLNARIHLLQGPPGTGKTETTAAAAFLRIAARCQPGEVVIIAANTHTAVDTVLLRLSERKNRLEAHADSFGLHHPPLKLMRLNPSEESACLDSPIQCVSDYPSNSDFDSIPNEKERVLVIGATTNAILKLFKKYPSLNIKLLVVDEASMMPFAHFLALASLVHPVGQMMLAGDHRQLAPIVAHDWEREDRPPTVKYQPFVSAFEAVRRLVTSDSSKICSSALTYTFRLPATIRSLLDLLYQRDNICLQGRPCQGKNQKSNPEQALEAVWRHSEGVYLLAHSECQAQSNNPIEVAIIEQLLAAAPDLEPDSVAIVTPHRAQRSLLKLNLKTYYGPGKPIGVIDTVEKLQGGERPTIIVSAAVSDPTAIAQEVSFILNLNRSNVAFSRTQHRLIVVCGESLLNYIPPDHEQYQDAVLWKTLRNVCTSKIAQISVKGHQVQVLEPTYSIK